MSLLFLYDSDEWSNHYLIAYLQKNSVPVKAVNFENELIKPEDYANYILIVNRLFPSAYFRGNYKTHFEAACFIESLYHMGIPMINSYESFIYDFSKLKTHEALLEAGLPVPCCYSRSSSFKPDAVRYPCVIKPDQGGRSFDTHIVYSEHDLRLILEDLPPVEYIIQEYIQPDLQHTLRVEVVGEKILSVFERTMDEQGLSAYSRGSRYKKIRRLSSPLEHDCRKVMRSLNLRMGSFDIIFRQGKHYFIDVNATSNYAEDDIETNGFNPLDDMAKEMTSYYNACCDNIASGK